MKIKRTVNGQEMEFELSPEELRCAHAEKQLETDMLDIENVFDHMTENEVFFHYGIPSWDELRAYYPAIAFRMREMIDEEDVSFCAAREQAINETLPKVENKKKLILPRETIDRYNALMKANKVDYEKEEIDVHSIVERWSVPFHNGYEVDIKVCSNSNEDGDLWCEAVLFRNGVQVSCTDAEYVLNGQWTLYFEDDLFFIVEVDCKESEKIKEGKNAVEKTISGVFIDPENGIAEKRTIVKDGTCQPYYDLLRCDTIDFYTRFIGRSNQPFSVVVDDNGSLYEERWVSGVTKDLTAALYGPVFICNCTGSVEFSLSDAEAEYLLMHVVKLATASHPAGAPALRGVEMFSQKDTEALKMAAGNAPVLNDPALIEMLSIARGLMINMGEDKEVEEMLKRIASCTSVPEAIGIINQYVHIC